MVMLNLEIVMNRLREMNAPTQEAIETMSLWVMHYRDKASIDVIVEGWLNSFRTAVNDQKRIALFYVMNDVVQKAKNKHVDTLIPAFQPAVLTAVGIGKKFDKVKDVMRRCITIFKERQVFTTASITAMVNLLASDADDAFDAEETALDVDSGDIERKITNFVSSRQVVAEITKVLHDSDFEYTTKIKEQMKNRTQGAHLLQEVHDAIDVHVNVRHSVETQKKKMIELIESLELAKRVFMHQKREVLVVEEAYVNFRDGIKAVRKEVEEMEQFGNYPGVPPPTDVPSPTADDDIYATGVEKVIQKFKAPGAWDNRQAVDMEIDEEDRPIIPMQKPNYNQAQATLASLQPSLKSRIMQLGLKQITDGEKTEGEPAAKKPAPSNQMDFTKPPPAFNVNVPPPSVSSFGAPVNTPAPISNAGPPVQNIPQDPRKRVETQINVQVPPPFGAPQSTYAIAVQQGIMSREVDPRGPLTPQQVVPQQSYQPQYEMRDPRIAQQQQPLISPQPVGYQAAFDRNIPTVQQHQGYHATYETPAPMQPPQLVSPQPISYQPRYDNKVASGSNNQPIPTNIGQRGHYNDYMRDSGDRRNEERFDRRGHSPRRDSGREWRDRDDKFRSNGGGGYSDRRPRFDDGDNGRGGGYQKGGNDRWRNERGSHRGGGGSGGGWRGGYNGDRRY